MCLSSSVRRRQILSPDFAREKLGPCSLVAPEKPAGRTGTRGPLRYHVGPEGHPANQYVSEAARQ